MSILLSTLRNLFLLSALIVIFAGTVEYVPDSMWSACEANPARCELEVSIPERGPAKPNPNDVIPNPR